MPENSFHRAGLLDERKKPQPAATTRTLEHVEPEIQLMLGHADIKTTQRYLNITDEELRKVLTGVWERRRQLKAVGQ